MSLGEELERNICRAWVKLRGKIEGNIFATERCELVAGCILHGDVEAPRFVVDENATFLGSAKVGTPK